MTVLCANLDTLEPAEVRVATQIGIDTGRRPEDILNLTLDCLDRDKDGGEVLVYDNIKANRLRRRLPISKTTAAVITAQQQRVRRAIPRHACRGTETAAHTGAKSRRAQGNQHDHPGRFATATGSPRCRRLRTRDGIEFDKTRVVPYAYRHSYAQRHADAGVPIDVLAELLDHRSYSMTRRYYRIGEDRRRAAVDTVTALQLRPAWQPDLARRADAVGIRTRPPRRRGGRRPLRHLHRADQRQSRRRSLPGPVPVRGLRPLPHQCGVPSRVAGIPR